jgi:hypothetical protein
MPVAELKDMYRSSNLAVLDRNAERDLELERSPTPRIGAPAGWLTPVPMLSEVLQKWTLKY